MINTPQQVLHELEQRKFRPVYFFYGEENYYIDAITDYIADKVLLDSEKAFNLTIVYGKDQDMAQILGYARRYPVAAERQVVIVKEAQELPSLYSQAGQKLLFSYLQAPNPSTLLVFNYKYKDLDLRTTLSKRLGQDAVLVNAKKLYDNQIPAWITNYIGKRGVKIDEKACLMLQEMVGNDLTRLVKELDKLLLNLQQGACITDSTIQAYVGISKQFNVFELQKALATKNIYKANQIVFYWATKYSKSNSAIPVVALLFTFFTKLLIIHQTLDKNKDITKLVGINPYFLKEYLTAARHYPLAQVLANIEHLYQADLQLKGIDYSAVAEEKILKELVFKLMHS